MTELLQKLNFFNFYLYWNLEDILVVFLLYNFFKYIIMCSIIELIWPTQYFNKKHNIGYNIIKFRSYIEVLLKLKNYSFFYFSFNIFFLFNNFLKFK